VAAGVGLGVMAIIAIPLAIWLFFGVDTASMKPATSGTITTTTTRREGLVYGDKQTIKGWGTVVDPDDDCTISMYQGKMTIAIPGGKHDLTSTLHNAPRVWQEVHGDFSVQVRLEPLASLEHNGPASDKASNSGSGLLVWGDDDNFIRFERVAAEGLVTVQMDWFRSAKPSTVKPAQNIPDAMLEMRVIRQGSSMSFDFKSGDNASAWKTLHKQDQELPKALKVGVFACNVTNRAVAAALQDFLLEPSSPSTKKGP
jgi:hypothetical protein